MTPAQWASIEAVIVEWVRKSSGLNDQHVICSHQNVNDPKGPYITVTAMLDSDDLAMYPTEKISDDDEIYHETILRIEGHIDAWRTGALPLLTKTKSRMLLPSYYAILESAGIGAELDSVRYIPSLKNSDWEDHAVMPVVFHVGFTTIDDGGGSEPAGLFDKVGVQFNSPDDRPFNTIITGTGD